MREGDGEQGLYSSGGGLEVSLEVSLQVKLTLQKAVAA